MTIRVHIQVEESGFVTVTVDPQKAAQQQQQQQWTRGKRCIICSDKWAFHIMNPTCGACYTAGMTTNTLRDSAAASESADNEVAPVSGRGGEASGLHTVEALPPARPGP